MARFFRSFLLFWLMAGSLAAQSWNNDGPLPVDKEVLVGQLDNGLKYYIRENKRPEGRASFRLVVNAGSLQEDDDQRGLAHFVEHMAFNGTRNFPKQELVGYLQGLGMRFGADLNAYTSFDETVYMLDAPMGDPEVLETTFQVLSDWADGIEFDPIEVDKERDVIVEEWRSRQDAAQRLSERQYPAIYYRSRYARRIPIGSMPVVRRAPTDRLVSYYRQWYRPSLMGVIAVGDFKRDDIEQLIIAYFGDMKDPEDAQPRVDAEVPDHADPLVSIESDPELTISSLRIHNKMPIESDATAPDYRRHIVQRLYFIMMNARLDERTHEANPPYVNASVGKDRIARLKQVYSQSVVFFENEYERGVEALLAEVGRARREGFTRSELDRAKADVLRSLESANQEHGKTESSTYTAEYTRAYTVDEPIPGIAMELEMTQVFLESIDLAEVNAVGKVYGREESRVVLFSAPEKEGLALPNEKGLRELIAKAEAIELPAFVDDTPEGPLMEEIPAPGSIVSENYDAKVDVHEWTLSNGVRVLAKRTEFKNDELVFSAFSPGGSSLVMDDEYVSATMATTVLGQSGLGRFSASQLEKLLAGKDVRVSPYIGETHEGFQGGSSPQDLETLMQLVNLNFTQPRLDPTAYSALRTRLSAVIENRLKSPQSVFQDAIEESIYGGHHRHRPMSEALLKEIDPELSLAVFQSRFRDAGDFTFVFVGSMDLDQLKELSRVYLGSLPASGRVEKGADIGDARAKDRRRIDVAQETEPKASIQVIYTGEAQWSRRKQLALAVVRDLLTIRLRDSLREENGGTYGVGVFARLSREPREEFTTGFGFTCDPYRLDMLLKLAIAEIEDMKSNGPRAQNLGRVKEIHLRSYESSLQGNGYWLGAIAGAVRDGYPLGEILDYPETIRGFDVGYLQQIAIECFDHGNLLVAQLNPKYKE